MDKIVTQQEGMILRPVEMVEKTLVLVVVAWVFLSDMAVQADQA